MKKNYRIIIVLGFCLCLLLILSSCPISLAKYTRAVQRSAPLSAGSTFAAQTHNGSITVYGADIADCNLTATITARAATEETAKKLAEKTTITLEPSGNKLTAKIEKPTVLRMGQSVAVSLDVRVPDHTSLELKTHNGSIRTDLPVTVVGEVSKRKLKGTIGTGQGKLHLQTHNGSIKIQ